MTSGDVVVTTSFYDLLSTVSSPTETKFNGNILVGSVVALAILLLVVIVVLIVIFTRRKRQQSKIVHEIPLEAPEHQYAAIGTNTEREHLTMDDLKRSKDQAEGSWLVKWTDIEIQSEIGSGGTFL